MTSQGEESSGSVAAEISGRSREVDTAAAGPVESKTKHSREELELQEAQHAKVPGKDATLQPLLAGQDQQLQRQQQHLGELSAALPPDAGGRHRVALSTGQWRSLVSFCAVLLAGIIVIISLLVLILLSRSSSSNSSSAISVSNSVAAATPPTTAPLSGAVTRLPLAAATANTTRDSSSSIIRMKTLSFELNTSALPACQQAAADRATPQQQQQIMRSITKRSVLRSSDACVNKSWIVLHGSSELPIGPFACSSKAKACQQMVNLQTAESNLQAVLSGIYKIRAQVTLQCQSSEQEQQQQQWPIILILYAPNDTHQNDNHQVCQSGKVQTLHTAATLDLKAGDSVSLKLQFSKRHPVEVKVLAIRASSQMTWEVLPSK